MFNKLSKKMSKFGGNIDVEKRDILFLQEKLSQ